MSPFDVTLLILNPKKSTEVSETAEKIYSALQAAGIEVLLDDRAARPGVKFADADLIGIPHRLVIGERGLRDGVVEYRHRRSGTEAKFGIENVVTELREHLREG
jgi:prolyl-tRNA synthetase